MAADKEKTGMNLISYFLYAGVIVDKDGIF